MSDEPLPFEESAEETAPAPRKFTARQNAFIDHYLDCLNATKAATRAGYSEKTARQIGARLLSDVDIRAEIDRRAELTITKASVLRLTAEHASGSMEDFLTITDEVIGVYVTHDEHGEPIENPITRPVAYLDLEKAQRRGKLHLIKKYSNGPKGVSLELYSAQEANRDLGKFYGLYADRTLNIDLSQLSDEQLARIANGEDPMKVVLG